MSSTPRKSPVCVSACWGGNDLLHCWIQQPLSFRGDAASTRMIFSPLNAFYGELSCQHMGSACFYSFQTALLSSAASFIPKLLESSREMKAGAGVLARHCLAKQAVFSLLFAEEPRQENDSPLSIMNLAERLRHLLTASVPGSCKMERAAVTRGRTTGSSVQFFATNRLLRCALHGKESRGELRLHCRAPQAGVCETGTIPTPLCPEALMRVRILLEGRYRSCRERSGFVLCRAAAPCTWCLCSCLGCIGAELISLVMVWLPPRTFSFCSFHSPAFGSWQLGSSQCSYWGVV